jgi:xanthine/uracil permease
MEQEVNTLKKTEITGYLPDETPQFIKLILFALQQIVVMFPATVLVALITGFHVSTTIFASGLATLGFILITKREIPLYYGSSFSCILIFLPLSTLFLCLYDTIIKHFKGNFRNICYKFKMQNNLSHHDFYTPLVFL